MAESTLHLLTHRLRHVIARNSIVNHKRGRAIMKFANKVGFVYFGSVDQHDDDHHIVRGLTVSSTHQDSHYSVGSFDGYDVSIVDRLDTIDNPSGVHQTHTWLIVEVDLHNAVDIPHVFMGAHSHTDSAYSKLFTAFPALQAVPLGTFGQYPDEFTKRYSIYTSPTQFIEVERYFTPDLAQTLAVHFWPLSLEILEGSLYVYADNQVVSSHLLDTMLKNALWLATQLDSAIVTE